VNKYLHKADVLPLIDDLLSQMRAANDSIDDGQLIKASHQLSVVQVFIREIISLVKGSKKRRSMNDNNIKTVPEINVIVGKNIQYYRKAIGMTQTQLGEALGIVHQQVCKYEKGTSSITAVRLLDIARLFGVQLEDFYKDKL